MNDNRQYNGVEGLRECARKLHEIQQGLKPCPDCGGRAALHRIPMIDQEVYLVQCEQCGLVTPPITALDLDCNVGIVDSFNDVIAICGRIKIAWNAMCEADKEFTFPETDGGRGNDYDF